MNENEDGIVSVDVAIPESEPAPDSPTVVVVTNDESDKTTDLDHESRITALEIAVEALSAQVANAAISADVAMAVADEAASAATDAVEIAADSAEVAEEVSDDVADLAPAEDTDDEIVPESARPHWMFRSRDEWRNK